MAAVSAEEDVVLRLEQRLRLLASVTNAFAEAVREPELALESVATHVARLLGDQCVVLWLNAERTQLEVAALHDEDPAVKRRMLDVTTEPLVLARHAVAARVVESGEPFLATTFDPEHMRPPVSSQRYYEWIKELGVHSMLVLPLRGREHVVGALSLIRYRPDRPHFDEADLPVARALADHAALLIENARAFTAERQAREQLRLSAEHNRQLFEASRVPMFAFEPSTHRIVDANAAAVSLYGYQRDELLAMRLEDLRHPDDLDQLRERMRAGGRGEIQGQARHRRKDGATILVEGTSYVTTIGGRELRFATVIDVTERERARDAQHRAEQRFSRVFELGLLGVAVVDARGRVVEINDALLDLLGYTREEALDAAFDWFEVLAPEWRHADAGSRRIPAPRNLEPARAVEYLRKDGSRVAVLTGATVLDTGDRMQIVIDLEGQRWASGTLQHLRSALAAESRFRAYLETAPDAIVIADQRGEIVLVNARALELFGYRRDELVGANVDVLVPESLRAAHHHKFVSYFDRPRRRMMGSAEASVTGRRKDGSEFPIEVSLSPLATDEGTLVTAAIRDVTERRAMEAALQHVNRELEAFSYSVAHDLRAPLRAMSGFASLLLEDYGSQLDEQARDWVNEITGSARRMSDLVDALLSLSRITRSDLEAERVDLSWMAAEVAATLAAREPGRHVAVTIEAGLEAVIDPALGRVLLENLVSNARKFTRDVDTPLITIGQSFERGRRALFVRDNGAGFDMKFAGKLFAPFQRLHSVAEFPGTGIGLATAQRIVHRHGGEIWATGEVGAGATVFFTLPGAP